MYCGRDFFSLGGGVWRAQTKGEQQRGRAAPTHTTCILTSLTHIAWYGSAQAQVVQGAYSSQLHEGGEAADKDFADV